MIETIVVQIALKNVSILIITAFVLVILVPASAIFPKLGYQWCALRRIQAIDVMDEAIRMCAEKGKPLYQYNGQMTFGSSTLVESLLAVARYLTKGCAQLGVRYISATADSVLQLALLDFARQGYVEAGRPEMYNSKDVRYITAGFMQTMFEAIDTLRRDKPAALVAVGHIGSGTPISIFSFASNQGTFVIGSSVSPDEMSQAAMTSDYSMVNEEQIVMGAYIDNDPEKMAVFVGEDVIKLTFAGVLIVGAIIKILTGVKIV